MNHVQTQYNVAWSYRRFKRHSNRDTFIVTGKLLRPKATMVEKKHKFQQLDNVQRYIRVKSYVLVGFAIDVAVQNNPLCDSVMTGNC